MLKSFAVNFLVSKYPVNYILATSILSNYNKKTFSEEDLDEIFNRYKEEKAKPFVKWVGGKRQLLKQFKKLELYPPEEIGFDSSKNTYFEPFVGGGAVFLDTLPEKAILSDMNEELVITYNVIKTNLKKLIFKLKIHKKNNSKEYFLKIRSQQINKLSNISIAARFIYLNRTCFNGMYRVNKSGGFNVPYGKYDNPLIVDEDNLKKISKSLQKVKILHQDYKKTIEKAKKGDFIYFDPPYAPLNPTSSFTAYTKDGFGEQQQIELRDTFYKLHKKGCFVMLSNSNSEFINKIYGELENKDKKIKITEVDANRMINSKASGRGKIKEVLVTNY
ncbi:MAG: DNA adenine methylase [Candidatus Pacebacteria bacterium]|nr:DNA adenine methylase [Candidatus Paceibacterota bacterium]